MSDLEQVKVGIRNAKLRITYAHAILDMTLCYGDRFTPEHRAKNLTKAIESMQKATAFLDSIETN